MKEWKQLDRIESAKGFFSFAFTANKRKKETAVDCFFNEGLKFEETLVEDSLRVYFKGQKDVFSLPVLLINQ